MGTAHVDFSELQDIDFSLFNQAAASFRNGQLPEAVAQLNEFKQESGISDLTILPLKQAYFEVLVSYQAGCATNESEYFEQCANAAEQIYKNIELPPEFNTNIATMLAESLYNLHRFEKAVPYYQLAVSVDPEVTQVNLWYKYFQCKISAQHLHDIESIEAKIIDKPGIRELVNYSWLEFAVKTENRDLAMEKGNVLLSQFENLPVPFQIKVLATFVHDLSMPERVLDKIIACQQNNNNVNLWILESISHRKMKNFQQSVDCIVKGKPEALETASGANCVAMSYEKLKDYDNAWFYFEKSAKYQQQKADEEQAAYIDVRDCEQDYDMVDLNELNIKISADAIYNRKQRSPIFMVGFPRSGTTLLDTVFKTNENFHVISEVPFTTALVEHIQTVFNKRYPQQLNALTEDEIDKLRVLYENMVARKVAIARGELEIGEQVAELEIVDKNPTNTEHLPLILLLYPNARVIVSLRNPLDTVLSCFQQNFRSLTSYTSYEKCADKYVNVMSFYQNVKQHIKFNGLEVKYEDLVNDFQSQMQKISGFLNVALDKNADKKFADVAKSKIINTASKDQVTQGLYTGSKEKWKNYASHIQPYKAKLQRFINLYDYE